MAAVLAFALTACGQTQQTELTNSSVTDKQMDNEETPTQSALKTTEPSEVPETASLSETFLRENMNSSSKQGYIIKNGLKKLLHLPSVSIPLFG